MKRIFKHQLRTTDLQTLYMPEGATVLTVQTQRGEPCLWALVDPGAKKIEHIIAIHGTGRPVPDTSGDYIGTYQLSGGALVFHVFKAL